MMVDRGTHLNMKEENKTWPLSESGLLVTTSERLHKQLSEKSTTNISIKLSNIQ